MKRTTLLLVALMMCVSGWSQFLTDKSGKLSFDGYFNFLKNSKIHAIYFVDHNLENVRDFVEGLKSNPGKTLYDVREDIDENVVDLDFVLPPHLRQGFLVGATAGVAAGV